MPEVVVFRTGFHAPRGASAVEVLAEQRELAKSFTRDDRGFKDVVPFAAAAVLSEPERWPQTALFIERDPERAVEELARQSIRTVWGAIVYSKQNDALGKPLSKPVEVRVLHNVTSETGQRVYEPLEVVRNNDYMRRNLLAQLQQSADYFSEKQRSVLAEIGELA
jgi:hypothetical protein